MSVLQTTPFHKRTADVVRNALDKLKCDMVFMTDREQIDHIDLLRDIVTKEPANYRLLHTDEARLAVRPLIERRHQVALFEVDELKNFERRDDDTELMKYYFNAKPSIPHDTPESDEIRHSTELTLLDTAPALRSIGVLQTCIDKSGNESVYLTAAETEIFRKSDTHVNVLINVLIKCPYSIRYIKGLTETLVEHYSNRYPENLGIIPEKFRSLDICRRAVEADFKCLMFCPTVDDEMIDIAVKQAPSLREVAEFFPRSVNLDSSLSLHAATLRQMIDELSKEPEPPRPKRIAATRPKEPEPLRPKRTTPSRTSKRTVPPRKEKESKPARVKTTLKVAPVAKLAKRKLSEIPWEEVRIQLDIVIARIKAQK